LVLVLDQTDSFLSVLKHVLNYLIISFVSYLATCAMRWWYCCHI